MLFWILISWKMPQSGDQIIIMNFDLMKTGKIIWSHEKVNFNLMKFNLLTLSQLDHQELHPSVQEYRRLCLFWSICDCDYYYQTTTLSKLPYSLNKPALGNGTCWHCLKLVRKFKHIKLVSLFHYITELEKQLKAQKLFTIFTVFVYL
jgi:hypothetical protein